MNGLNVYFASKVSDYLGTGKLIFSMTTKIGPTVDVLKETNHIVCEIDDVKDIKDSIIKILNGDYDNIDHTNSEKYSSKNIVKIYDKKVEEMINGKK